MSLYRTLLKARALGGLTRSLSTTHSLHFPGGYLSDSYKCNNAWNKRLESSLLKKIEMEEFFYEMDNRFKNDKAISAVDVDLFANKVTTDEYLEELEELLHRLRKSPVTHETLPSTGHAVIRSLLELDRTDILMRILQDRVNYGVFTDDYLSNILMDRFLKEENYRDAAKVATLHMLEEDFGGSATKLYAVLSCLKYLENPTPAPWSDDEIVEVKQEEAPTTKKKKKEEETKIKIRHYLRQPGFDDHFDLTNKWHLIGKSLALLSFQLHETDEITTRSLGLLGWALYDKWERVENILKRFAEQKAPINSMVLKKISELAKAQIQAIEASPDKTLPRPKLHRVPGMNLDKEGVDKLFERLKIPDYATIIPAVKAILDDNKVPTVHAELIPKIEELLKKTVAEVESEHIARQQQLYQEWEKLRTDVLLDQVQRVKNEQKLQENEDKKRELAEREEALFFFDNEEEWMLRQPPAVRVYKMRWRGKYKPPKKTEDDTYVPPTF